MLSGVQWRSTIDDFPKKLSAKPTSQNESSKAAPHMKVSIAPVPANPGDGTQESEVKAEKVTPHLRKSIVLGVLRLQIAVTLDIGTFLLPLTSTGCEES